MVNKSIAYVGLVMTSLGLFLPVLTVSLIPRGVMTYTIISDKTQDNPFFVVQAGPFFLVLIIFGAILTAVEKPKLALSNSVVLLITVFLLLSLALLQYPMVRINIGGGLMLLGATAFLTANAREFRAKRGA